MPAREGQKRKSGDNEIMRLPRRFASRNDRKREGSQSYNIFLKLNKEVF
jgi:hypothetical protein